MTKQHLLLVDGDPRSLRVMEASLRRAGFAVTTAVNGEDALAKCQLAPPDLILSDTQMSEMDGFELCRRLKADERLQATPFVFLTGQRSVEDKVRGLELGVEDYLTKPIYIREVVTRVRILLERKARERQRRDQRASFSGHLSELGVVDLVQTLDIGKKTGTVRLRDPAGRTGTIWFREGHVVDCEADRRQGEAAFYRLLTWHEGEFAIDFQAAVAAGPIRRGTQSLLIEGMRRVDEWARLAGRLPGLDAVVQIHYRLLSERLAEIPDDVNAILKLVDGHRTLGDVVADSDQDDLAIAGILGRLWEERILELYPPGAEVRDSVEREGREAAASTAPALARDGAEEAVPLAVPGTAPLEVAPTVEVAPAVEAGSTAVDEAPELAAGGVDPPGVDWFAGPAAAEPAPLAADGPPLEAESRREPSPPRVVRFASKRQRPEGATSPTPPPASGAPGSDAPPSPTPSPAAWPVIGRPTPRPASADTVGRPTPRPAPAAASSRPVSRRPRSGRALVALGGVAVAAALAGGALVTRRSPQGAEDGLPAATRIVAPAPAALPEPAPVAAAAAPAERGVEPAVAQERPGLEAGYGEAYAEAERALAAARFEVAVASYRRALALHESSAALAGLGAALHGVEQLGPARDAFRRAIELDDRNAAAYMGLGRIYLREHRSGEARSAFQRYLALEPEGRHADEARAALAGEP